MHGDHFVDISMKRTFTLADKAIKMLRQVHIHQATLPMCKRMAAEMSHSSSKRSIVTTFLFATKCNSISGGAIKTFHYCATNNPVLRKPLHLTTAAPLINSKVNMSREDKSEDGIIHLNQPIVHMTMPWGGLF